jgi:disulfide bond formation protein DsbB
MGRNLYILAGTLLVFAIVSFGISYTNIAQQPGSPGDTSLWRTMGLTFFFVSMVISLAAVLSSLFEQAERHTDEKRRERRQRR